MTDIPPPRWQVIERGRRLEVIDRQTGLPVGQTSASLSDPVSPSRPGLGDRAVIRTARWFDDKGPRTIALTAGSPVLPGMVAVPLGVMLIGWFIAAMLFPILWFVPLILLDPRMRFLSEGP